MDFSRIEEYIHPWFIWQVVMSVASGLEGDWDIFDCLNQRKTHRVSKKNQDWDGLREEQIWGMGTGHSETHRNPQQALAGKASGAPSAGASLGEQRKISSASSSTHKCYVQFGTPSTERHQHIVVSLVEKYQDDKTGVASPQRVSEREVCIA